MKQLILFLVLTVFLSGCSKEKQNNRLLKGKWKVTAASTYWANGSNSQPSYSLKDNYATIEFDKNGKGKMTIPAGVEYWNGNAMPYPEEIIDLEAGIEKIRFNSVYNNQSYTDYFNLSWKWNKKSFVLSNGDIHYYDNNSYYSETKFICEKEK